MNRDKAFPTMLMCFQWVVKCPKGLQWDLNLRFGFWHNLDRICGVRPRKPYAMQNFSQRTRHVPSVLAWACSLKKCYDGMSEGLLSRDTAQINH